MFLNGNHKNLRRSDFSFLHEKSPEKGLRPSKISKKLAFSNLNTPQEKILFDTTNLAGMNVEMYGEINVSPFCLKGGVENKENITVSSSKLSIPDILSFSDLTLENEIEKKSVIEEEFPIDCLPLPLPMSIFRSPMRSLSFEDKEDFFIADIKPNMKPQNKEFLEETLLDTNQNNTHPDIPTISCYTLKQLINKEIFGEKEVIIIDCRYLYEYEGGHIENSLNFTNPFDLESMFFKGLSQIKNKDNYIIIFHCEFSQKRGPKMYRFFRKKDREINESNYPSLLYPHIYLLDGGYNKFVKYNSCLCSNNGNYISMFDKKFKDECIQSTSDYNKAWKNKKEQIKQLNICRNHSFNF